MEKKTSLLFATAGVETAGKEYQTIQDSFVHAECRTLFSLNVREIGPKLKAQAPEILHISAHGRIGGKFLVDHFEETLSIGRDQFAAFLGDHQPPLDLAVFCVCFSDSLAREAAQFLPCAIGFQGELSDDPQKPEASAALWFSESFYKNLNEYPGEYYNAYCRTKKEWSLANHESAPRFFFHDRSLYSWNEFAWKKLFSLLLKKDFLAPVLEEAGLPQSAGSEKGDRAFVEQTWAILSEKGKLFYLRDLLDTPKWKTRVPELRDFEDDLIVPNRFPVRSKSGIAPVNRKSLRRSPDLGFFERMFFSWLPRRKKQKLALKHLGIFDNSEVHYFLESLNGFFSLSCSDDKGGRFLFSDYFLHLLDDERNDSNFYLLLGETGTGKSTALLELFTRFAVEKRKYSIVFAQFHKDLNPIYLLPDQEKVVLLLDGIDEVGEALQDPESFFADLEVNTRNFAKVVISCRPQFFKDKANERTHTAHAPGKEYQKWTLSFLDEKEVQKQIAQFYRLGSEEYQFAIRLVQKTGYLFKRPLLLRRIKEIVDRRDRFVFHGAGQDRLPRITHYEIYNLIVDAWIDREGEKLPHRDYRKTLWDTSMAVARELFRRERAGRLYLPREDLKSVISGHHLDIEEYDLRVRSLLHRNEEGYYRFSHRMFKEFFYAQLLYEGVLEEENFPFAAYPDTLSFFREMCEVNFFRYRPERERAAHVPGSVSIDPGAAPCLPVRMFCAFRHHDPAAFTWLDFESLTEGVAGDLRDCFTDLADYVLRKQLDEIPGDVVSETRQTYELEIEDLLDHFFFKRDGDAYRFLHRSIPEFFLLKDLMDEEDREVAMEMVRDFPFEKLRFGKLFPQDIQWLRLRRHEADMQLWMDNHTTSEGDFRASGLSWTEWYDYFVRKGKVLFSDYTGFLHRLIQTEKVRIRLLNPEDSSGLSFFPFPEKIRHLDLSHNSLRVGLPLGRFSRLESLDISGNPLLQLDESDLPASLALITADEAQVGEITKRYPGLQVVDRLHFAQLISEKDFREPDMVEVKAGRFWMGSRNTDKDANEDEKPLHLVELSGFHIARYPVTVEQFARFVLETGYVTTAEREGWAAAGIWRENTLGDFLKTGCDWTCDEYGKPRADASSAKHPVIYVRWEDALAWCGWLSEKTGKKYGLPTEAQWEYAAMGGHSCPVMDEEGNFKRKYIYAGSDRGEEVAWHFDKFHGSAHSNFSTKPVGALVPNELGLFDMSGNVWEWCTDRYGEGYYEECQVAGVVKNPPGPESGSLRVSRGGSWGFDARHCRTASRNAHDPRYRFHYVGFRPVFVP